MAQVQLTTGQKRARAAERSDLVEFPPGKRSAPNSLALELLLSLVKTQTSTQRSLLELLARAQLALNRPLFSLPPLLSGASRLPTPCFEPMPTIVRRAFPRIDQEMLAALQTCTTTEKRVTKGLSLMRHTLTRHCPDLLHHVDRWMAVWTAATAHRQAQIEGQGQPGIGTLPTLSSLSTLQEWPRFPGLKEPCDHLPGPVPVPEMRELMASGCQEMKDEPVYHLHTVSDALPVAIVRVRISPGQDAEPAQRPCAVHDAQAHAALSLFTDTRLSPSTPPLSTPPLSDTESLGPSTPWSPPLPLDDGFSFHFDEPLSFPAEETSSKATECTCPRKVPTTVEISVNEAAHALFGWTPENLLARIHDGQEPFCLVYRDAEVYADVSVSLMRLKMEGRPFNKLVTIDRDGSRGPLRCMMSATSEAYQQIACFTPVDEPTPMPACD